MKQVIAYCYVSRTCLTKKESLESRYWKRKLEHRRPKINTREHLHRKQQYRQLRTNNKQRYNKANQGKRRTQKNMIHIHSHKNRNNHKKSQINKQKNVKWDNKRNNHTHTKSLHG